jgi:hypothetical protein
MTDLDYFCQEGNRSDEATLKSQNNTRAIAMGDIETLEVTRRRIKDRLCRDTVPV